MLVVHDGQELVHGEHLGQRLCVGQLLGALQRDGVGQRPVGVVGRHQVVNVVHLLLLARVHLLPAQVTMATGLTTDNRG